MLHSAILPVWEFSCRGQGVTAQAWCLSPPLHLDGSFCFLLLFVQLCCQSLPYTNQHCYRLQKTSLWRKPARACCDVFVPCRVKECSLLLDQRARLMSAMQEAQTPTRCHCFSALLCLFQVICCIYSLYTNISSPYRSGTFQSY